MKLYNLIIFILIFHFTLIIKRSIFPNNIFFYESIILLLFFSILLFIITNFGFLITKLNFANNLKSVLLFFFINYSFLITLPTLSNRSISVFLLNYIEENEKNLLQESKLINDYIHKTMPIKQRINEQLIIKNISKEGTKYKITERGRLTIKLMRFLENLYSVN